ncbi:hypothetical protein KBZ94_23540 [Streptomyces sp. RM72]|uniref:hypothetical protein n=1 Tax=Streptomyces sp. RM72 TaxID=1115510 RepID=UPI001B372C6B|nr:hypothetical protein [Streptomyces sp. RM72]MBQ0887862.1 hypothetical protein [Streptomyces sp. RM72]
MKLSNANCGTSRPLTMPEAVVLIVITIVAGTLAAAGWPAISAAVLVLEALSLGRRLLVRLRRSRTVVAQSVQA